MVPPRWLRRLVLAPAVLLLTVFVATSLPLTAIAAAFASRWLPGRWRPLRLLWFLLVYLVVESVALIILFALWLGSGFGRRVRRAHWQHAHYTVMRWYLDVVVRTASRAFNIAFDIDAEQAAIESTRVDGARPPTLVFSRHAGPGDSFLLVHGLLQLRYRPRIVLKGTLRWAPVVDVALHRVPSFFVVPGAPKGTGTAAVGALAAGLGPGDALVLFPEGRNFTPTRRTHSIAKLEDLGQHHEAEDARELRHVLAPRSGGALAALARAPTADVVFVAHTGLEDLSGIVDLWRGMPMDAAIEVQVWRVPAAEIPRAPQAQAAWLAWWWRRIDAWIIERHGRRAVPDAVVAAVEEEGLADVPPSSPQPRAPSPSPAPARSPSPIAPRSPSSRPSGSLPDTLPEPDEADHRMGLAGCFSREASEGDADVADGWDNQVTRLDGGLIARFPRRAEAIVGAQVEAALLPILAAELSVDVPVPLGFCAAHGAMLYRAIPGQAASRERIESCSGGSKRFADQAADLLLALRGLNLQAVSNLGLADRSGSAWSLHYEGVCSLFAERVLPQLPSDRVDDARQFLAAVPTLVALVPGDGAVVHADLGPSHLLCDDTGLAGVIDWTDAHIGDPAIDLAWLLYGAPAPVSRRIASRLDVGADVLRRAGTYHRLGPWYEVVQGLDVSDVTLVDSGIRGILQRLPGWDDEASALHLS